MNTRDIFYEKLSALGEKNNSFIFRQDKIAIRQVAVHCM